MAEAMFSLLGGIVLAFIFSWKVALVALCIVPFMVVGSAINAKFNKEKTEGASSTVQTSEDIINKGTNGDLLANDAISNYRTVAGFGLN